MPAAILGGNHDSWLRCIVPIGALIFAGGQGFPDELAKVAMPS